MRFAALLLFWIVGAAGPASAQAARDPSPAVREAESGSDFAVYLLTMGPGDAVWERFGHNALWLYGPEGGVDVAYNYGVFDFEQDAFVPRLLRGRMLYALRPFPGRRMIEGYARAGRSVRVQELNLTSRQKRELRAYLEWNARPKNRDYRYDYFRANCSTKVRDALDRVLGGEIRRQLRTVPTGTTYRSHALRLVADDPAVHAGMLLALAGPADRPLSAWEASFVPMRLERWLRVVSVPGPGGERVPLVRSERVLYDAGRPLAPEAPPNRLPGYLLTGLLLGGLATELGWRTQESRAAAVALSVFAALWGLVAGVLGTVLLFLWTFTDHVFAYGNENLFQANPLALGVAVLVPAAVLGRGGAAGLAARLARALAALAFLGMLLQALPGFDQLNGEVVALALPVHVGMAAAVRRLTVGNASRLHPRASGDMERS